jgi:hypothetical protein
MAALWCAVMLTGYICGAVYQPNMRPGEESLCLDNCSIVKNAGILNASMTIVSTTDKATAINEIKISNFTLTELPGVTLYLNGTAVNCTVSPLYILERGNTVLVNMVFPCTNSFESHAHEVGYVTMVVLTAQAMYYTETAIQ